MSLPQIPLRTEPLVDEERFPTIAFQAFFEDLAAGDLGTSWTPTFTNLTETGVATITGTYFRLGVKLAVFIIVITPETNTSATANSTYCDNFPLVFNKQGVSFSVAGTGAVAAGITTNGRIYTGTWTNLTTPVTLIGLAEVR